MARFLVGIPFVGYARMEIEADNPQLAFEKALDTELTMDNIDKCTVGEHFAIDDEDIFASYIEMDGNSDMPIEGNFK